MTANNAESVFVSLWNEAAAHTPREARFVCVSYGSVPPNLPISLGILHWLCGDHAIAPTSLMESWGINYINHMDHIPLPDLIKMRQSLKQSRSIPCMRWSTAGWETLWYFALELIKLTCDWSLFFKPVSHFTVFHTDISNVGLGQGKVIN